MSKVLTLMTEYAENPFVDSSQPCFSWQFPVEPGLLQCAYRLRVTEADGGALVWDSGRVLSGESVGVVYDGAPLRPRTPYRVECEAATVSGGVYTGSGRFETAFLDAAGFIGQYISMPANFAGAALLMRRKFTLDKPVLRARAYVCGLGCHEVYVNGGRIGEGLLNPAVSGYDKRVFYLVYDITAALLSGTNVFGCIVGNGWYGQPVLNAQLHILHTDGTETVIFTEPGQWWITSSHIVSNSLYGGEVCDGRLYEKLKNFSAPAFVASTANNWNAAIRVQSPGGAMRLQTLEQTAATASVPPISERRVGDVRVYDFGAIFAGVLRVRVEGDAGARIIIDHAEGLYPDGRLNKTNLRSAGARDEYILSGNGEETYMPRFTYHGFRYAGIETVGNVSLRSVEAVQVRSAAAETGSFSCSDAILNKLHQNCVLTEGSNLQGLLTDCPQRDERFGWLNDLTTRLYQSTYNFDMAAFLRKTACDIADTQDGEGRITDTAPYYTGGRPADPVSVSFLLCAERAYVFYGDTSVMRDQYVPMKRWTQYLLSRRGADGLVDYSYYGDWCCAITGDGSDRALKTDGLYLSTCMLLWALTLAEKFAEVLGFRLDAQSFSAAAEEVRAAILSRCFDAQALQFDGGSQTANALALSLGLVPSALAPVLAGRIAADIEARGGHMSAGNQGYRHVLKALARYGYEELFYSVMTNPAYPGFGHGIALGATSVWERWEPEMQNEMHSYCHPMFSAYDEVFYESVAGIAVDPAAKGANRLIFAPKFIAGLTSASAGLDTVNGRASFAWERDGALIRCCAVVPPNVRARLVLAPDRCEVVEGKAEDELLSGTRTFTVRMREAAFISNKKTI